MENQKLQNGNPVPQTNGSGPSGQKPINNEKQAARLIRGMKIALDGRVTRAQNGTSGYEVTGDSGAKYFVSEDFQICDCPDSVRPCKHCWAARIYARLELKAAEIRCDLEACYETEIKNLERKLQSIAEQNFKLRTELKAFESLKESFKKLIQTL